MDDHTPILVGCGQVLQREEDPLAALPPIDLLEMAARRALEDASAGKRLLAGLDLVAAIGILAWPHPNPARLVAEKLGATPARKMVCTLGGNSPQMLVNRIAGEIRAGTVRCALLVGGEVIRTRYLARRRGIELHWKRPTTNGGPAPESLGDERPGWNEREQSYGIFLPIHTYPLFENGLRARRGWDLATHRKKLGRLCSRMTERAAVNPYAWFPEKRTAEEISEVTPDNRMIAFPYTKRMNAIMEVDQSAAVIMTSVSGARALGIPENRWVYVWGGGDAYESPWYVSDRSDFHSSSGMRSATALALARAGLESKNMDAFDLYSCFPSAVQFALEALGIGEDDPRPFTLTGGLPYAGGPGNNYSMHGIASLMEWLRDRPNAFGMVTALGWYMTKHSAGIYSVRSPSDSTPRPVPAETEATLEGRPAVDHADGSGRIETYTVVYDREGAPERGVVIARADGENGERVLASLPPDRDLLESFVLEEGVGRRGRLTTLDGKNRFDPR